MEMSALINPFISHEQALLAWCSHLLSFCYTMNDTGVTALTEGSQVQVCTSQGEPAMAFKGLRSQVKYQKQSVVCLCIECMHYSQLLQYHG